MRVIGGCSSYRWCGSSVRADNTRGAMANNNNNNEEEAVPLVLAEEQRLYEGEKTVESKHASETAPFLEQQPEHLVACGFPVGPVGGHGVVLGEPVPQQAPRQPWSTPLFCCVGNNDEFCMSDMQVCMLGYCAPCVLYASNMEMMNPEHESFVTQCVAYSSLYAMGYFLCGGNALAPCFAFPNRIALRRSHNLEGYGENFLKDFACCSSLTEPGVDHENCDSACDFCLHLFCHPCALCQEGREIRRRTAQAGQRAYPYSLAAPSQQTME